jgi:hypothetical protein
MSPSESARTRAENESLAIPAGVRATVDERDNTACRVCGRWLGEARALHHIHYGGSRQGMGGRRDHDPANIVTVCWMYGPGNGIAPCHDLVHSNKRLYVPLLEQVVAHPGITVMQLRRWAARTRR